MFDKNKFAEILQKIISQYDSMTSFAKKSSIDRAYLSKYINKKLEYPPSPDILRKISDNSNNIVDYIELMKICNYLDNNMENNMATHNEALDKLENIVMGKLYELEQENADLKQKLALANAKLEVYERVASVSNRETSIGFGPPIKNEE